MFVPLYFTYFCFAHLLTIYGGYRWFYVAGLVLADSLVELGKQAVGLRAGVSLLVHRAMAWRVLMGWSFPDVADCSVRVSWSCCCPAGGWGLTLEKLAEGLTVPGTGIRLQLVGLMPMGFQDSCWPTGEDNQGLGSDCSILGQVLGPLEGKDGSRRIQDDTSLLVGGVVLPLQ